MIRPSEQPIIVREVETGRATVSAQTEAGLVLLVVPRS